MWGAQCMGTTQHKGTGAVLLVSCMRHFVCRVFLGHQETHCQRLATLLLQICCLPCGCHVGWEVVLSHLLLGNTCECALLVKHTRCCMHSVRAI